MIVNQTSKLEDIRQALYGTWEITIDNGWKCVELGNIKFFKKTCTAGSNVLPKLFLNNRTDVTPVLEFRKNSVAGQAINLQQDAITVEENCVCLIIMF